MLQLRGACVPALILFAQESMVRVGARQRLPDCLLRRQVGRNLGATAALLTIRLLALLAAASVSGAIADAPFVRPVQNYYMTDPISRASETMAQCTALYVNGGEKRTGTDG